jgi:transmembrane sensor
MIKSVPNHPTVGRTAGSDGSSTEHDPALLRALAEASVWINWEHGPDWTRGKEEGLRIWLGQSELNQFAYRHTLRTRATRRAAVRQFAKLDVTVPDRTALHARRRIHIGLSAVAMLLVMLIGSAFYFQRPGLTTGVGEQGTVMLDDGTQVLLNTASRIVVDFNTRQRHVRLVSGEAFFKVAKRPDWPFVVQAGDHEITAVGTAFIVRRDEARVAVTLVEGRVAVAEVAQSLDQKAVPSTPPMTLSPGERLTYEDAVRLPKLDRPQIDKIMAWRQGMVDINDMTLAEAAVEMNRYSKWKLAVEGPAAAIRVGGVFRSTDVKTFATAVAVTHGLTVREEGGRIVLSGSPREATEAEFDIDPAQDSATH